MKQIPTLDTLSRKGVYWRHGRDSQSRRKAGECNLASSYLRGTTKQGNAAQVLSLEVSIADATNPGHSSLHNGYCFNCTCHFRTIPRVSKCQMKAFDRFEPWSDVCWFSQAGEESCCLTKSDNMRYSLRNGEVFGCKNGYTTTTPFFSPQRNHCKERTW